jgi:hypothetical protein
VSRDVLGAVTGSGGGAVRVGFTGYTLSSGGRRALVETARDVAIVVLAVINIVWTLALCVVGVIVLRLLLQVSGKAPRVLETAASTARTVRSTTESVGQAVAAPLIRIAALAVGLSWFLAVLRGRERSV